MYNSNIEIKDFLVPLITVPNYIFMLITGYFKAKSNNFNIFNILFVILFCWLINFLIAPLILWSINHKLDYNSVLLGGRDWWYIWAFLIIQLCSPILNLILQKIKAKYLFFVILIFIALFAYSNRQT